MTGFWWGVAVGAVGLFCLTLGALFVTLALFGDRIDDLGDENAEAGAGGANLIHLGGDQ